MLLIKIQINPGAAPLTVNGGAGFVDGVTVHWVFLQGYGYVLQQPVASIGWSICLSQKCIKKKND